MKQRFGWTKRDMRELFGPRTDGEYMLVAEHEVEVEKARQKGILEGQSRVALWAASIRDDERELIGRELLSIQTGPGDEVWRHGFSSGVLAARNCVRIRPAQGSTPLEKLKQQELDCTEDIESADRAIAAGTEGERFVKRCVARAKKRLAITYQNAWRRLHHS